MKTIRQPIGCYFTQSILHHFDGRIQVKTENSLNPVTSEYETEWGYIKFAAPQRQREFIWGRKLLRQLATQLSIPVEEIKVDNNKAPVLPTALSASISYCGQYVIAVAAHTSEIVALGVDIERATPLMLRLRKSLFTRYEQQKCLEQQIAVDPFKLLFSAKESLYKCYYNLTKKKLSFRDVSISFENDQTFSIIPERFCMKERSIFSRIRGFYWIKNPYVVTLFVVK
jgi:4'-phosphopantetheinyl transferase EntD